MSVARCGVVVAALMAAACVSTPTQARPEPMKPAPTKPQRLGDAKKDAQADKPGAGLQPDATMLQFPDVSTNTIVFVYANNIWTVPVTGGTATQLASPPGSELFPRFSPDGKSIAFVGNYDGNRDIYTIPTSGAGLADRITHHPSADTLCDWAPDGSSLIYYTNGLAGLQRSMELFTIPVAGGMPTKLPVPYGTTGTISPDGTWLAYTPHTTDFRTWKRYRGGMATDIWLFNLKDHSAKRMTDWEGTDTQPMWSPDGSMVYYVSDQGDDHRLNIWAYTVANGRRRQITNFNDFDCKFASIGPGPNGQGMIVFQNGPKLYTLDVANSKTNALDIVIPGDRPTLRDQTINFADFMTNSRSVSATGKRVFVEARGDIWSLPAEKGAAMNLTRTSGVAERSPACSPDGKHVAYLADDTGEYEIYLANTDGSGEARKLTTAGSDGMPEPAWKSLAAWSPDSKMLVFTDKGGNYYLHTLGEGDAHGTTKLIATDLWAELGQISWSSDSRWIALQLGNENNQNSINLYNVESAQLTRVTDPIFNSTSPAFDRKGDFLYFASERRFSPTYSDIDATFIYDNSELLLAVPLRKDVKNPLAPRNDVEGTDQKDESKKDEAKKDDSKKEPAKKDAEKSDDTKADQDKPADADKPATDVAKDQPAEEKKADDKKDEKKETKKIEIDLDGFEARAMLVPVGHGNFSQLQVADNGKLLYVRNGEGDRANPNPKGSIKIFDITDEKREEKTVMSEVDGFEISPDGKKVFVVRGRDMAVVDPAPDQKLEKKVPTDAMSGSVSPRDEWRQMFNEAWRLQRDLFYEPTMHGVNWPAMRERYGAMIDDCVTRDDLTWIISEMISELNIGHAYYRVGGSEKEPAVSVGMLGADYELVDDNGVKAFRITKIVGGAPWDVDARGPLGQPGVDVKVGDYLLAVNKVPLDTTRDIWASFQGLADKTVLLTVSDKPTIDDTARDVVVTTASNEVNLRYRGWIESKRAYVEKKSNGKIGYAYVPNTGVDGQNDLFRMFYGQRDKPGMIIDERWNGGGQIPTRFIELLNRPVTNYWARRDGRDWTWPPDSHQGPKAMLANGLSGSGGDMFPALFKQNKIGPVVGTRTWGGLVGISGTPNLIDGSNMTVPCFGYYKKNGTWGIEGHGVDPDIEVIDDPSKMQDGADPQLDAAIDWVLKEIQTHPYTPPKRPKSPDRSGMGVPKEEW